MNAAGGLIKDECKNVKNVMKMKSLERNARIFCVGLRHALDLIQHVIRLRPNEKIKSFGLFSAFMLSGFSACGQGLILFDNLVRSESIFAPVYGLEQHNPFVQLRGNATTNFGTQTYTGPFLLGTGYSAALYGGPVGITDENDPNLLLAAVRAFHSDPAVGGFFAGTGVAAEIPNVPVLGFATLQVRAWDNQGGTITSWAEVLSNPLIPRGTSDLFSPGRPLGGLGPDGIPRTAVRGLYGLTSFNLYVVPEPSVVGLGLLAAAGLYLARRKRRP